MSKKKKNNPNTTIDQFVNEFDIHSIEEMNDVINQLKKKFIENALGQEITDHLGYEKWD